MKGHIALCYAELIQEIWSGTTKTIAPLKLRVSQCSGLSGGCVGGARNLPAVALKYQPACCH